jgi:hypothetical protein
MLNFSTNYIILFKFEEYMGIILVFSCCIFIIWQKLVRRSYWREIITWSAKWSRDTVCTFACGIHIHGRKYEEEDWLSWISQTFENARCFSSCLPFVFIVFLEVPMTIWLIYSCFQATQIATSALILSCSRH